jgi:hypothetical protein
MKHYFDGITLYHTFVNIPALISKRTSSVFLSSRAGILTKCDEAILREIFTQ